MKPINTKHLRMVADDLMAYAKVAKNSGNHPYADRYTHAAEVLRDLCDEKQAALQIERAFGMRGQYILNSNGEPEVCDDLMTWSRWMESGDRVVAKDSPIEGVRVSTVFLGLDHNFDGGPPILFETMVFGGEHDGEQERYTNKQDAIEGHKRMVEKVSS